jgi:hypothetical protein
MEDRFEYLPETFNLWGSDSLKLAPLGSVPETGEMILCLLEVLVLQILIKPE